MARVTFKKGAKIERWEKKLDNPKQALKQIGELAVAESQAAFKEQQLGKDTWAPRGEVNVFGIIADFHAGKRSPPKRRFQDRPALRDTGRLASSIAAHVVSKDVVEIGSNLPYASVHHTGGEVESMPITSKVRVHLWAWLKTQGKDLKRRLGWVLNKKFRDKTLKMDVPKRPIVAVTKTLKADTKEVIGVAIFEVK